MPCSAVRLPFLRNTAVKYYSVAAAQKVAPSNVEVSQASNKIVTAALENNSGLARVSIVFRAGSRNETYDTQGTAHYLRGTVGLTTKRSTAFILTRSIQQLGGQLTATTDRESISYTLEVSRDNLANALKFLEDTATHQEFRPWELSDEIPRLRYELSTIPQTTRLVELLHKAAYRDGLGYSLYCPKAQLGKITNESLQHFTNTWFTHSRCAVVGTGVSSSEMNLFASCLNVGSVEKNNDPPKYHGGEIRKDRSSELASVAVAVESSGIDKGKEAIAFAVLQRAAGTGPRVKWGADVSPLGQIGAKVAGDVPFALSAFLASYTDSGIFGFVVTAPSIIAGPLTKSAAEWMRNPKLTDADISRGKAQLKFDILSASDNNVIMHENLAYQTVMKKQVLTPEQLVAEVDSVSVADVKAAASKCKSGKLSLAAIGNLETVPFVDQLS